MIHPYDRGRAKNREYQQEFQGINHKLRTSEAELSDALNLTSNEYPALTVRRERDYITDIGRCLSPSLCVISHEKIAYMALKNEKQHLCVSGKLLYTFEEISDRIIVRMGAYLCVFPDGIVYNTKDDTVKKISVKAENKGNAFNFIPSKYDGTPAIVSSERPSSASIGDLWYDSKEEKTYICSGVLDEWVQENAIVYANAMDLSFAINRPLYAVQVNSFIGGLAQGGSGFLYIFNGGTYITTDISVPISDSYPESPENGDFVLIKDQTAKTNKLYQYKKNVPQWVSYPSSYTRIDSEEDLSLSFSVGDVIEVSGYGYVRVHTAAKATENEKGYIVVDKIELSAENIWWAEKAITISRKLPENIANVIECSNRLWATDSEGHEIYASKLGDPFNWYAFSGLASDSYAITVGSGGVFTGAVSYDGYPHFFKENSILKVYGTYPFRLYTLDCPGVIEGGNKSLSVYNGVLIYKSINGFYSYNGSYPSCISENIFDVCGPEYVVTASCADNNSYYAAISRGKENYILVYQKGFWHMWDAPENISYDRYYGVPDLIFTGRDIIAAFIAQDSEIVGLAMRPTVYLVSFSGINYAWRTAAGKVKLKKVFPLIYDGYLFEDGQRGGFKCYTSTFNALRVGETFVLNKKNYFVYEVVQKEKIAYIDVGVIGDATLISGQNYDSFVFEQDIVKWFFTTADLGFSLPDDKYFSRLIFRYISENEVELQISVNGGAFVHLGKLKPSKTISSQAVYSIPERCDYLKLRFSGIGRFDLLSIARNIEGGNNP